MCIVPCSARVFAAGGTGATVSYKEQSPRLGYQETARCMSRDVCVARSRVVIVEDGRVALIRRVRDGRAYYVFPGGGVEPGETPEQAATREAYEELGVRVRLDGLLADVRYREKRHLFYRATVVGGEFGTGTGAELASQAASRSGSYEPVWVPLTGLLSLDARPRAVAVLLASGAERVLPTPIRIIERQGRVRRLGVAAARLRRKLLHRMSR